MVNILGEEGIILKTASTGDDVGVQMSGSGVRRASTLNNRIGSKGADRAKRTRELVKVNPAALKLTMAGTMPVQAYGHQAQGASMSQMTGMRKNIKNTTPFAGSFACSTTVVGWHFGPTGDPFIKCPLEQIDTWIQTWNDATATDRHDARVTWQRCLTKYLTTGKYLNSMGPVAATINSVLRAGWKPARPDLWQVEEGTNIEVTKLPLAKFQIIARAQHDLQVKVWAKAAAHEHGGGLETGIPSFQAARDAVRYLKKHGYYAEARALEYVLVGFFRDPDENTPPNLIHCPRCANKLRATRYHTTYECDDNRKIEAEIFIKSNKILKEAKVQHKNSPCLWLRG